MAGAEPLGGAQAAGLLLGAVEHGVHPRLVVARASAARRTDRARLVSVSSRHRIAAPGLAHQALGIGAVAARDHHFGQRERALGRNRRFVFEPRPHRGVVAMVVPQRGLDAPAQEGLRRPARIGRKEGAVALDRGAVVVAAQDQPFRELARDRIRYRGLRPAWRPPGFCLRTSSMTFSSASLSACEVDDVAATAAGATCLRGGGKAACWRVAGARTGGAGAGAARRRSRACGRRCAPRCAAACAVDLGTTLRAIGRGFGSGTFGLAQASSGKAASPTASARLVASAVDRKAAARAEGITAFLCGGESFNRSSLRSI